MYRRCNHHNKVAVTPKFNTIHAHVLVGQKPESTYLMLQGKLALTFPLLIPTVT
jgi:hypothetical protein